ncbi:hypothetical protein M2427_007548 [Bradyrhizobium sp. BR13661]|jgi:hypothetical protein|nr:hypothetical protein [Bradyrhizobium sp. BR13661]
MSPGLPGYPSFNTPLRVGLAIVTMTAAIVEVVVQYLGARRIRLIELMSLCPRRCPRMSSPDTPLPVGLAIMAVTVAS